MKTLTLLSVYVGLVLLLLLTLGIATLPSDGIWKPLSGLVIAAVKAGLIGLFFMDIRYQKGLVKLFSVMGLFWLFISFVLTASDYFTRQWH